MKGEEMVARTFNSWLSAVISLFSLGKEGLDAQVAREALKKVKP